MGHINETSHSVGMGNPAITINESSGGGGRAGAAAPPRGEVTCSSGYMADRSSAR